jgi:hypothetical protein
MEALSGGNPKIRPDTRLLGAAPEVLENVAIGPDSFEFASVGEHAAFLVGHLASRSRKIGIKDLTYE